VSSPEPQPGWPLKRIVLVPLVLFVVVSATVFTLAKLHLARPDAPSAAPAAVTTGDPDRGVTVFASQCAGCHGEAGAGGGIGPRLAGAQITLAATKAQIDNGGGAMPAGLVSGQDEEDVLAYLATILQP
jgi:mono/diheme cytochrome c family protein